MTSARTRLQVTWLTPFVPFPPDHGGAVRIYNLIRHLSDQCDIDLLALSDESRAAIDLAPLQTYCRSVQIFQRAPRQRSLSLNLHPPAVRLDDVVSLHQALQSTQKTGTTQILQIDYPSLAQYHRYRGKAATVLTAHDVTYLTLKRRASLEDSLPIKLRRLLAAALFYRYEINMLPRFDAVVTMSEYDRQTFQAHMPHARLVSIPNGVDCAAFTLADYPPAQPRLLFLGNFQHPPNVDAVLYFAQEVWPRLSAQFGEVIFTIVGANPPDVVKALATDRIHVMGRVPDVNQFYAQALAMVVPLRFGSGTRLKILEAFGAGTPVISTSIGIEGLEVIPDTHFLAADTPEAFIAQVNRLLTEPTLGQLLRQNARALVEHQYDWKKLAAQQLELYETLRQNFSS